MSKVTVKFTLLNQKFKLRNLPNKPEFELKRMISELIRIESIEPDETDKDIYWDIDVNVNHLKKILGIK